jgi:FKBP-type peptidyl-prolyl cis-trans isomerase 2
MQNGDVVRITYTAKVKEGGQQFDSGVGIPVVVGAGYVIPGVDEALQNMNVGEKKSLEIVPEKGFGVRNPELVKIVPEAELTRHNVQARVGMTVEADNMRGRVVSMASGRVTLDFNHPLAGKVLLYDVEVKEKLESKEEQVKALIQFFARFDPLAIKLDGDTIEVEVPPLLHPVMKKRIADEIRKHLGIGTTKFMERFERPKEQPTQ